MIDVKARPSGGDTVFAAQETPWTPPPFAADGVTIFARAAGDLQRWRGIATPNLNEA